MLWFAVCVNLWRADTLCSQPRSVYNAPRLTVTAGSPTFVHTGDATCKGLFTPRLAALALAIARWNTRVVFLALANAHYFCTVEELCRKMTGIFFQCALKKQHTLAKAKQQVLV